MGTGGTGLWPHVKSHHLWCARTLAGPVEQGHSVSEPEAGSMAGEAAADIC